MHSAIPYIPGSLDPADDCEEQYSVWPRDEGGILLAGAGCLCPEGGESFTISLHVSLMYVYGACSAC